MDWNTDNLDLLISYLKEGLTKHQIAKKMSCSYDAVDSAVKRYALGHHKAERPNAVKVSKVVDLTTVQEEDFEDLKENSKLKWTIEKSVKAPVKNRPYKLAIVTNDHHIPHHDESAIKAILQLMNDVTFDVNVILGDYLDYGCISHWNKNKRRTLEMQRLKKDYITGNAILDAMDKCLPKNAEKHFFKGNHEVWIDDLLEEMPQLEGMVEPNSQLFLTERGYKIYEYNDIVKFGRLNLTHGIYASSNPIKKHLDDLKVNIMFGHTHTLGMMLSSSPARDIAFAGYNTGCLCNMAPDYMRGRPHAWTHGFAIVYLYPNGYFDVQLIRIVDGRFVFNGKVYDGKKK